MKRLMTFALLCAALFCFAFAASAADDGGLVAVAFRGDTSVYPPNSLGAIEAAFDAGADYVSVSVQKTADGAFVLLEDRALPVQCDAEEGEISSLSRTFTPSPRRGAPVVSGSGSGRFWAAI